jgi:hypothetical protein
LATLINPTNIQGGEAKLQKNERVGSIMETPDNPENVAEEK